MQVELNLYEMVKTFQYRGVVCTKPFKICGKEIKAFCFQRGYRGKEIKYDDDNKPYGGGSEGKCYPSLYKLYELDPNKFDKFKDAIKDCEDINHFSIRQRGGGSPLNIDFTGMANGEYNLTSFNEKDAWLSIFDMAGSKALTKSQPAANSYKAFQTYGSPTATQRMYKDTASGLPFGFVVTA
ncbi:MAG: hypothetical protein LBI53_08180 [Candidatus Peribacteria bacterium]|jgi:hypothetical protein|nr:hypothetical protein [Candidatus Peribacteria bacterium]